MSAATVGAVPVLVVDDDADIRASVAEILRGEGYAVCEAEDGERALQLIDHERFAVMVLDIQMPRCGGVAVLDALDDPPPVVVMSAHPLDGADKRRLRPKIRSFLRKPFPPRLLIDSVAAILGTAEGGS